MGTRNYKNAIPKTLKCFPNVLKLPLINDG